MKLQLGKKSAAVLIIALFVASLGLGVIAQANEDQAQLYTVSKTRMLLAAQNIQYQKEAPVNINFPVMEFFVEIYHHADLSPRANLVAQNFTYDCVRLCVNGIHYFKDPTTLITSQGRGIEQCLIFGVATTDTCTASNFAKILGWSVSTATPAAGDTYAGGAGVACSSSNVIVDAYGLAAAAGTVTPGANGATVTTTIAKTFSITGTYTAVQAACMLSALPAGTNPLLYAESTFGPDSFVNGDSLTGTWSVART